MAKTEKCVVTVPLSNRLHVINAVDGKEHAVEVAKAAILTATSFLMALEGREKAAESVYRIADAVVATGARKGS